MNSYKTYILRDLRIFVAELMNQYIPEDQLYSHPFGEYIHNQFYNPEVQTPFRDSYNGDLWFKIDNYELNYKIWQTFYFIRSRGLYNKKHSAMMRLMSMVRDDVDEAQIQYLVYILFKMKRVREN